MRQQRIHTGNFPASSLWNWIVREKLSNPLGVLLLVLFSIGLGYVVSFLPLKLAMLLAGGALALVVLIAVVTDLLVGVNVMLVAIFLLGFVGKYTDAPIGTALDGLLGVLLLGLLGRVVSRRDLSFAWHPLSLFVLGWIYYNLMQVLNPWALSRMAWVYTVRTVALLLALYFIACYALSSYRRVVLTLKMILGLGFLSALYGLKQEYIGFSPAELAWVTADQERFQLIFQWSRLRVFSFFSDPTTYGILMAYMCMFAIVLATGPFKIWKRLSLVLMAISMLVAMALAGSRTPVVMIPLGLLYYVVITLRKETILSFVLFLLMGTAFVLKSTNSAVIYRIQSAFKPESKDTIRVRLENQKKIQPFIQSHPFGAGLGSTGFWGKRFSPDSWLASFAHDSLYVRLAVETGWVGLLLYMSLLFMALRYSIYYYFRTKAPPVRNFYLGISVVIFMLIVASYPQEAITLPPTSLVFYVLLAMVVRLKDFDKEAMAWRGSA